MFPEKALNEDEDTKNLSLDGMFETLSDANDDVLREEKMKKKKKKKRWTRGKKEQ